MKVTLLAFPNVLASAVTGLIDTFRLANRVAGDAVVDWRLVGPASTAGTITTSCGLGLAARAATLRHDDWLVLPGLDHASVEDLVLRVQHARPVVRQVKRFLDHGSRVASACSSAFFLAEAGAISGRKATVSWWLAGELARRYPQVQVQADQLTVRDGPALTAGAVTAYHDLALELVEEAAGPELRSQVAKIMLLDPSRESQAPYAIRSVAAHGRPLVVDEAHRWLVEHLADPELSLTALADHCCVSPRTLLRRFRESHGRTPQEVLRELRIERACSLLESSTLAVEQIAFQCGYTHTAAFRTAFRAVRSMTPGSYRRRFALVRGTA